MSVVGRVKVQTGASSAPRRTSPGCGQEVDGVSEGGGRMVPAICLCHTADKCSHGK